MRCLFPLALTLALSLPACAETVLSEATGNWAGASNQGLYFRAQLTKNGDDARLTIWQGAGDGVPEAQGEPEFDNGQIALGDFSTGQKLEVVDGDSGSILQIVTEFEDEEAKGRTVTGIQFLDNQYTVVSYYSLTTYQNPGGVIETLECDADLRNMVAIENGEQRKLDPVGPEALNARNWTWNTPLDRGYRS